MKKRTKTQIKKDFNDGKMWSDEKQTLIRIKTFEVTKDKFLGCYICVESCNRIKIFSLLGWLAFSLLVIEKNNLIFFKNILH